MTPAFTALQLLQLLTQAVYFLVFLRVALEALRRPRRANIDITLYFGAFVLVVASQWANAVGVLPSPALSVITGGLLMALPYLMLRLVDDFLRMPRWTLRLAEVGLALSVAALLAMMPIPATDPRRLPFVAGLVLYFVVFEVYGATQFVREARASHGVTQRRMQAVAAGSFFLGLTLFLVLPAALAPSLAPFLGPTVQVTALASGLAYALGFTPPGLIRRAWQEPELRAFLSRAASLPRLPSTDAIVQEVRRGAAAATGAQEAGIGLWDAERGVLRYAPAREGGQWLEAPPSQFLPGRAFSRQQAIFSADAMKDDPENAAVYEQFGARAVLAAPITAGERRLGVLLVFAPRPPIFAEDDLQLVRLLADQAAVVLESRALIDEASRVRAREEVTRLRDDFLSSAAHDLKTPLTTLLAQAQLLERRALRTPDAPADLAGIQRLVSEARRLSSLVLELLDASRAEQGRLMGARAVVDLALLATEACAGHSTTLRHCSSEVQGAVLGMFDAARIAQLFNNLLENAIKYSPNGGEIKVRVWQEGQVGYASVADHGIGIPAADLSRIFDRFHRATNVDDRRFAGMGLGLFICRAIVEEHQGRIWATSEAGQGTTFHIELPLLNVEEAVQADDEMLKVGAPATSLLGGV
jgi:signal transduction histidine kinase